VAKIHVMSEQQSRLSVAARALEGAAESLRERKKRETRQHISDTATAMFLERGFDEVTVAEVAKACNVSEKTIYNYFSTKEALLLDREPMMAESLRRAFGPGSPERSPVEAALQILTEELASMQRMWKQSQVSVDTGSFLRFREVLDSTPSLRAAQHDMTNRLARVGAEAMAARAGISPDDPEPKIAADALMGLWRIQYDAMFRHFSAGGSLDDLAAVVTSDVRRAARLIDAGLWTFGATTVGKGSREQFKAAGEAALLAGRQVATALRHARSAWAQLQPDRAEMEARLARREAGRGGQRVRGYIDGDSN